jgi:hypothetical protein
VGSQANQLKHRISLQSIDQDKIWKHVAITMSFPICLQRVVIKTFGKLLISEKATDNKTKSFIKP